MPEAICLGETLLDMFPDKKGVAWSEISSFSPVPGGAPANVSVGLAKLGVRAGFIGKVGKDPFGRLLVDVLQQNGVDVSQVKFDPDIRTTLGFVSITREGENDFFFYRNPGADTMLRPDELDEDIIAKSKVFHFGSVSMTAEPSCSATLKALQFARRHKVLISFDPNLRPHLWKDLKKAKGKIMEGLESADLVKVNNVELEFLTGTGNLVKGTNSLLQRGPKVVVVTLGERGSFFRNRKGFGSLPTYRVKVVDTVGCGDAFTAAIIHQFLLLVKEGRDVSFVSKQQMEKILKFASAAGALTATRKGVMPSLPTRKQVEEFLGKVGKKGK